jgi:hypothetical protein
LLSHLGPLDRFAFSTFYLWVPKETSMAKNLIGQSDDPNSAGVLGEGFQVDAGTGVYGRDRAGKGNGVIGYSDNGRGVWGHSKQTGEGVLGESKAGNGIHGVSETGMPWRDSAKADTAFTARALARALWA